MRSALVEDGEGADIEDTVEEVDERRDALLERLKTLEAQLPPHPPALVARVETHRDVLLKELMWMSVDFEAERKRHGVLRKKLGKALMGYFKALENKRQRSAKDDEIAKKRVAGKVSKLVKQFWFKIDQIIGYKARLNFQAAQRKAMDRHLVHLVKQTEKYTGDLAAKLRDDDDEPSKKTKRRQLADKLDAMDSAARGKDVARPYLLDTKLSLRPYQQVGLNWLASMHARRLNGILADEMGLGKTVQAISLLAHLACSFGIWGPHLVVAPTSVLVNWEMELKKFCPGLKVVTYYGAAKARKNLRTGWSKPGAFHVCVTSYQLAVQDATVFRRKKFYYLILDEAHNVKNFESRRWRTLLAFQAQRRLLLTGTPLQNSLMELWSLMHFLMPHLFRSRAEFSYWFANPLQGAVEGRSKLSDDLVKRLHAILRPFVLRRLKKDVAKQLPPKHEHEIKCQLSRRQQLLYEDFMSRSSTRVALEKNQNRSGGDGTNFVSMMNVVMQLRKVCNHPDLFEPRPVVAPFVFPRLDLAVPGEVVLPSLFSEEDLVFFDSSSSSKDEVELSRRDALAASDDLVVAPLRIDKDTVYFLDDVHVADSSPGDDDFAAMRFEYAMRRRRLQCEASETVVRLHRRFRQFESRCRFKSNVGWRTRLFLQRHLATPFTVASEAVVSETTLRRNRARLEASSLALEVVEEATVERRYLALTDVMDRFIVAVPKAIAKQPRLDCQCPQRHPARGLGEVRQPTTSSLLRSVEVGLLVSFPDRSLVQWDSGKFHSLAPLLRDLKRDGHRCLIFTQMSKMLDVLEAFLCFHGHTYSRLDGATAPDERQRRVDRFNTDESLFCMVLSTRSGGLGINLTGADIVIFYDSDWNPAMDAQATDRAHRIGQTREVHIYRLICDGTVEENILTKAKQKRRLNHVAITSGQFDAAAIVAEGADLTLVEDAEDVESAKRAEKEARDEVKEFDEQKKFDADETESLADEKKDEDALEEEFAAWQERVGPDPEKLSAALKPIERYALAHRSMIDLPVAATSAAPPPPPPQESQDIDVEAIEEEKRVDEERACREGDIFVSDLYFAVKDDSGKKKKSARVRVVEQKREFAKQRRVAHAETARRRCTGAAWERRVDFTGEAFWYNVDTYEWSWRTPAIIQRRDAEADARRGGYAMLAKDVLARVVAFSKPGRTRGRLAVACRNFASACRDDRFAIQVLPAEKVAALRLQQSQASKQQKKRRVASADNGEKKKKKRRRSSMGTADMFDTYEPEEETWMSLSAAVKGAAPGSTLVLCPGHYWEDGDVVIDKPLRIVGDPTEPTRVVVELGGSLRWRARAGGIVGVSFRRPRVSKTATHALTIEEGTLCASKVVVDNHGAGGAALFVDSSSFLFLDQSRISRARASALVVLGRCAVARTALVDNGAHGLFVNPLAACLVSDSYLLRNDKGPLLALPESLIAVVHTDLNPGILADDAILIAKNSIGLADTRHPLLPSGEPSAAPEEVLPDVVVLDDNGSNEKKRPFQPGSSWNLPTVPEEDDEDEPIAPPARPGKQPRRRPKPAAAHYNPSRSFRART